MSAVVFPSLLALLPLVFCSLSHSPSSIIYFLTFNPVFIPETSINTRLSVCLSQSYIAFLYHHVDFLHFLLSRPDIPDDEAQYWTSKLDRINTMQIHDEVSFQ